MYIQDTEKIGVLEHLSHEERQEELNYFILEKVQEGSQSAFINAWWEGEANPFKSKYFGKRNSDSTLSRFQ